MALISKIGGSNHWIRRLPVLSCSLVLALSISWMGNHSYRLFDHSVNRNPLSGFDMGALIVAALVFLGASIALSYLTRKMVGIRTLSKTSQKLRPQAIVCCCSPLNCSKIRPKVIKPYKQGFAFFSDNANHEPDIVFSGEVDKDIALIQAYQQVPNDFINWQQMLRVISGNISQLQQMVLVCSKEMAKPLYGEVSHSESLMQWLQWYVSRSSEAKVVLYPGYVEKDSLASYYSAFMRAISSCVKEGASAGRVAVNVTGGQTPASIAGSMATMHNQAKLQYVNNVGELLTYDVDFELHENK